MTNTLETVLKPGDCLLYAGTGLFSKIIMIKTWSPVSHCEVYAGNGVSWASRDGKGVGTYPLRAEGLTHILRPAYPLDLDAARAFADATTGQEYDWLGLFSFFAADKGNSATKQFCSEFAARLYNRAGLYPFGPDYDCDRVSPGMFLASPAFTRIPLP